MGTLWFEAAMTGVLSVTGGNTQLATGVAVGVTGLTLAMILILAVVGIVYCKRCRFGYTRLPSRKRSMKSVMEPTASKLIVFPRQIEDSPGDIFKDNSPSGITISLILI